MTLVNTTLATPVRAGSADDLRAAGTLLTKVGALPVLVVWHDERPYAIEDRCPHLGFPLHQGTVEAGLITCHWHHARFDLASGCTLDPWADDAIGFDCAVRDGDVWVNARTPGDPPAVGLARLRDGLEHGFTLVIAKAVLGLLEAGVDVAAIVAEGVRHGLANRAEGWSSGLTTLVALANLAPDLAPADRAAALVHGLVEVARSTNGHPARFGEAPLAPAGVAPERVAAWYRRLVETRTADAAERTLATLVAAGDLGAADEAMFAAITDHVFIDEGHTLDFTNKAFEAIALLGPALAPDALGSLVAQTCAADRAEESGPWQHPVDLAALAEHGGDALASAAPPADARWDDTDALAHTVVTGEPHDAVAALVAARTAGATAEELARAVAYAAALRLTRFHVRNDPGDWDTVHHAFTTANALHQAIVRRPTPELLRGVVQVALRVHLDRFLNVPAARIPDAATGDLAELDDCWDRQGQVDRAGAIVVGHLRGGGSAAAVVAALGHALLVEDAGFHWYQIVEAAARQATAWPAGEQQALVLAGAARFLAAHTPTRRERAQVIRTATLLRRGEPVFEE